MTNLKLNVCEEEFMDLDLLPKGLSPLKHIISPSDVSMEKKITTNTEGIYHTIDGFRIKPIEEVMLFPNTLNATIDVSCANVVDKESKVMTRSRDTNYLFVSWPSWFTTWG